MARYDRIYEVLARRAVNSAVLDVEAFVDRSRAMGMSIDSLTEQLMTDFETDGPLFGRFNRNLSGASSSAISTAERQGAMVGSIFYDERVRNRIKEDAKNKDELLALLEMDDIFDEADPEVLDSAEKLLDDIGLTWVATLVRTCHRCLPLHGITKTKSQWEDLGLHPATIHSDWNTPCRCIMVPEDVISGREDLMEPLKRARLPKEQRKDGRKTERILSKYDPASAKEHGEFVDGLMATKKGRDVMRQLGNVGADDFDDEEGP